MFNDGRYDSARANSTKIKELDSYVHNRKQLRKMGFFKVGSKAHLDLLEAENTLLKLKLQESGQ